jgi:hypothetical protein
LDGVAFGVGGTDDDLADGGVFGPWAMDVFEVIGSVILGVVALAVEGVGAVGACGSVFVKEGFPRSVGGGFIAFSQVMR